VIDRFEAIRGEAFGGVSLAEKCTFVVGEGGLGRVVFRVWTLALVLVDRAVSYSRDLVMFVMLGVVQQTEDQQLMQ
jgi:hypothetical protein